MKKSLVLLLVVVMLATLITGCGTSGKEEVAKPTSQTEQNEEKNVEKATEKPAEKVKLKVMILSEDSNRQAIYQNYYSKINEVFPDYEVEFELPGSASNYANKMTVYNASETLPDIFWGGDIVYQSGQAMPLTNVIKENGFLDNYSNKSALIPAPDGEIYCLSSGTDSYFAGPIFYNKDIFAKEGLEMPDSYEGLLELVKTLKEKGYVPISATSWALQNFLFQDLLSAEDPEAMIKLQKKEIGFEDPLVVEAARKLQELTNLGAFPVDVTSIEHQVHEQLFIDGKAAMIYHPVWVYPAISGAEFEIGFDYLPEMFGAKNTVTAWGSATAGGFMVAKNTKYPDAAVEVAQWMVMQDAEYFNKDAGNTTAIKGFDVLPESAPEVTKFIYGKMVNPDSVVIANFPTNYLNQAQISEYETNVQKLVTDQLTPEEFGKTMSGIYN